MKKLILALVICPLWVFADSELIGNAAIENRYFLQDALYPEQHQNNLSALVEAEYYVDWNEGEDSLLFKGFYRIDQQDNERSHGDIREFFWLHVGDNWELKTGLGKVFWGQTESLHLVDVINQTDAIEAIDGEDKLGQPMVSFALIADWGTATVFALPYFRERTFAGTGGRFRTALAVDTDNPLYESSDEQQHLDWAARWQRSIGQWELGLSYFDGTSREPDLVLSMDPSLRPSLRPFYRQMTQVGVDALVVVDGWLLKFEGIRRKVANDDDFVALVGGFEYTRVGVLDSVYDIGWLMEYQYDERNESLVTFAQNDLMFGSRLALNDTDGTEILIAYVQDLDNSSVRSGFVEASSRINNNLKWRFDAWLFSSAEPIEPTYIVRLDDYIQLSLEYYF